MANMPATPAENQTSWRSARGDAPSPGLYVALYTVSMPRPQTPIASSGTSHSKLVSSRRSKRIRTAVSSPPPDAGLAPRRAPHASRLPAGPHALGFGGTHLLHGQV